MLNKLLPAVGLSISLFKGLFSTPFGLRRQVQLEGKRGEPGQGQGVS